MYMMDSNKYIIDVENAYYCNVKFKIPPNIDLVPGYKNIQNKSGTNYTKTSIATGKEWCDNSHILFLLF